MNKLKNRKNNINIAKLKSFFKKHTYLLGFVSTGLSNLDLSYLDLPYFCPTYMNILFLSFLLRYHQNIDCLLIMND